MAVKFNETVEDTVENRVRKTCQLALRTEFTGIMLVHVEKMGDNKLDLRSKVQSSIKFYKAELNGTLSAAQQTLTPSNLCHDVMSSKIKACLQLK